MTADPMKFARKILKDVSRSFALTIPMLDAEIRDEVLLVYLQDRILDNFEDEIQPAEIEFQKKMMDKVCRIFSLEKYDRSSDFKLLQEKSSLIADKSLKKLTENIDLIYQSYQNFDEKIQLISHKWLAEMNRGMQKYLTKTVKNFADLDEYCYYVAGTVGGFLTETIIYKFEIEAEKAEILRANFNDAGLFLQKVNLIRDIREDLAGRDKHFWPLKELGIREAELIDPAHKKEAAAALAEMLSNLKTHIPALKEYYLALPDSLKGYKKFFAVNNGLALATIDKLEDNLDLFYGEQPVKVSKLKFLQIIKSPEKYFLEKASKI